MAGIEKEKKEDLGKGMPGETGKQGGDVGKQGGTQWPEPGRTPEPKPDVGKEPR